MHIALLSLVILTFYCGAAISAPASGNDGLQLETTNQYYNHRDDGFEWGYGLSDGRYATQSGFLKKLPDGSAILVMSGVYSFVGLDGVTYIVNYTADETGYHPKISVYDGSQAPDGYDLGVGYAPPPMPGIDPKVLASLVGAGGSG